MTAPGPVTALNVVVDGLTLSASWTVPATGDAPTSYLVQLIETFPRAGTTARTVAAPGTSTAFDLPESGVFTVAVTAGTATATGPTVTSAAAVTDADPDTAPEIVRRAWQGLGWAATSQRTDLLVLRFLTVYLALLQPLLDVAEDTDDRPGYAVALDPVNAPWPLLPWLAQWVGQRLPDWVTAQLATDAAPARTYITSHPTWQRGSVPAIRSLVTTFMAPAATIRINDRVGDDPFVMSIDVWGHQFAPVAGWTTDAWEAQLRAELETAVPAWVLWTLNVRTAPTYADTKAAEATYAAREAAWPTYADVAAYIPPS